MSVRARSVRGVSRTNRPSLPSDKYGFRGGDLALMTMTDEASRIDASDLACARRSSGGTHLTNLHLQCPGGQRRRALPGMALGDTLASYEGVDAAYTPLSLKLSRMASHGRIMFVLPTTVGTYQRLMFIHIGDRLLERLLPPLGSSRSFRAARSGRRLMDGTSCLYFSTPFLVHCTCFRPSTLLFLMPLFLLLARSRPSHPSSSFSRQRLHDASSI